MVSTRMARSARRWRMTVSLLAGSPFRRCVRASRTSLWKVCCVRVVEPSMLRSWARVAFATCQPAGGVRHLPAGVQLADQICPRHAHVLEEDLVEARVARHLHEGA